MQGDQALNLLIRLGCGQLLLASPVARDSLQTNPFQSETGDDTRLPVAENPSGLFL